MKKTSILSKQKYFMPFIILVMGILSLQYTLNQSSFQKGYFIIFKLITTGENYYRSEDAIETLLIPNAITSETKKNIKKSYAEKRKQANLDVRHKSMTVAPNDRVIIYKLEFHYSTDNKNKWLIFSKKISEHKEDYQKPVSFFINENLSTLMSASYYTGNYNILYDNKPYVKINSSFLDLFINEFKNYLPPEDNIQLQQITPSKKATGIGVRG